MSLLDNNSNEELKPILEARQWKLLPRDGTDDKRWIFINNHKAFVKSTNIKEKVTFDAMAKSANAFKPSVGGFFIQTPISLHPDV
ncbi:unnamed protein product [Mesocestoides corti]|uniref:Restriction endonuclease n=1 Tax=Mesocestoides corti TaxID=53468 RepID=A0A0R3UCV3_MESCO|nr:unnamed protein product [Mesocestoides corti]